MLLLGCCLALVLSWSKLVAVWESGTFIDTDDALHLVQVRDWLAGQGWFDPTVYRMDPPQGVLMHWTRLTDVPLALLIRCFAPFTSDDSAERLMRISYPIVLQLVFFAGVASVARKLMGARAIAPAIVLAAFSVAIAVQFPPGRINHHNVQIVLLVFMLSATLDLFEPRRTTSGALAGILAGASLAISIEDLPFIMVMVSVFGTAWIVCGASMSKALARFGGGLGLAGLVFFVVTVPPWRYAANVCDAFSGAHLIAVIVGGLGFVVLAAATSRLPDRAWRLAAAAFAGALVLGSVAVAFPDCLKDPFSAVDPLVREMWLANVTQGQPLAIMLMTATISTLPMAMPIFLGLALACLAAWREEAARSRWLAVAAFAGIGVVGAFWEVRVATYAAAVTVFGGAWLYIRTLDWASRRGRALLVAPVLLAAPVSPIAWALYPAIADAKTPQPYGDPGACFRTAAFTALNVLPNGDILAPLDPGPYILALTPHSVVAGPYHRNNHGNRLAIEAFLGDDETAHDRVRASGARYLAVCPAADELAVYAARAPKGLAALLRDGAPPPWLQPVEVRGTPYRVYEIR